MTRRERWQRRLEPRGLMAMLAILFAPFAILAAGGWISALVTHRVPPDGFGIIVPLFILPSMGYAAVWPWLGTATRTPGRVLWTGLVLAVGLALSGSALAAELGLPILDSCDRCLDLYPQWLCWVIGCFV